MFESKGRASKLVIGLTTVGLSMLVLGSAGTAQVAGGVRLYAVEDFEAGDMSLLPWSSITCRYLDPWGYYRDSSGATVSDVAHTGKYSLRINARECGGAGFSFTIEFPVSGEISFFVKVERTPSTHPLIFYIDDRENGRFFGNFDWIQVTYPVSAGRHTFKWISTGTHNAWIDNVELRAP